MNFDGKDNKDDVLSELKQLSAHQNLLLSKLMTTTSLTQVTQTYRENNLQISNIINDIIKVLNVSCKDTTLFYAYKNEEELLKGQQLMLEIGLNVVRLLDSVNNEHRVLCFKIIELLLDRGEFDLSSMSSNISEKKNDKVNAKMEVCSDFINFMMKTLQYTLEKLSKKVNDESTKHFIEYFLSVAYFRLPQFRKAFLNCVSKDVNLCGIKEDLEHNDILTNPVLSLIDWQNLFFDKLNNIKDFNLPEKITELDQILMTSAWQERISKRGLGFFYILSKLEKYISKKIVATNSIKWTQIPGFNIMIESIIHELKTKNINSYPEPLTNILLIFINDYEIMNRFLKTILQRTK